MNIVVCVKQVPQIDQIKVQNEKVSASGNGMTNPFDMYAIEEAIRIKEKIGGETMALSFGPEDSEFALREALSLGMDHATRVWDNGVEGSDITAISEILAAAIRKIRGMDMAIFGKQAVDDDSSSMAGAVAGHLGWSQLLFVKKIREITEKMVVVERATEDGYDVVESSLPAVISVVKEINEPRLPSLKGKMRAKKAEIALLKLADLGIESSTVGSSSPSHLLRAQCPAPRPQGEMIKGNTPQEQAEELIARLKREKII